MSVLTVDGVIGLDKRFDVAKLRESFSEMMLEDGAQDAMDTFKQVGLKMRPNESACTPFSDGVGSLFDKESGTLWARTEDFTVRTTNDPYLNTVMDEMEELAALYGRRIGRVRFMRQDPKTCLSLHRDLDEFRFHIPISTNGNVFFVIDNQVCRMPTAGAVYVLNTRGYHTIVNADEQLRRIHLLFDTYPVSHNQTYWQRNQTGVLP